MSRKLRRNEVEVHHEAIDGDVRQIVTGNRAGRSGFARRYARGLALSSGMVREALESVDVVHAEPAYHIDAAMVSEAKDLGMVVYHHMMQVGVRCPETSDVAGGIANAICGVRSLFEVDGDGWPVWSPNGACQSAKVDR